MVASTDDAKRPALDAHASEDAGADVEYVVVRDLRAEGDLGTCLRPLGLCELGGACDSCWYRPDHPRFRD
jgi:hypothetical protein